MTSGRDGGRAGDPIEDVDSAIRIIRESTFCAAPSPAFRIGLEAELLPIDRTTERVASVERAVVPALEALSGRDGWRPVPTTKGAPVFELPEGGRLTFEPGGQIEYAAPPLESPSAALAHVRSVLEPVREALADSGIDLYGLGIDPFNGPESAELQVVADRYRRMDAYYGRFGPAGARMMRQTASIQINVDSTCEPGLVWQVLNALAPVLVATFANSRHYAGRDTGYASFRSRTWQLLDRTRTGLPWNADQPDLHYAEFALDAPDMFNRRPDGDHRPFRDRITEGGVTRQSLHRHLTTLFPEVRPRRYFEVRSIDALPLSMYAAPVLMLAGLLLDETALREAAAILGPPETSLLRSAARSGLRDSTLADRARRVSALAMQSCRDRPALCEAADVSAAEAFFAQFTEQRRSPADAPDALRPAATAA